MYSAPFRWRVYIYCEYVHGSQSGSRTFYLHQRQRDGLVQAQSHSLALGVEAVHVEEEDHSSVRVVRIVVVVATTSIPNDAAAGCVGWAGGGSAHDVIYCLFFMLCISVAPAFSSFELFRLMLFYCVDTTNIYEVWYR